MAFPTNPEQIVFSGGGPRCFWQGGVMSSATERYDLAPQRITGVSGGALAGAAYLAGRERDLLDAMCVAFEAQDTNVDAFDPDGNGVTPHQTIYSEVVARILDNSAASKIADGPQFQIQISHPPMDGASKLSGVAATVAYEAELRIVGSPISNGQRGSA